MLPLALLLLSFQPSSEIAATGDLYWVFLKDKGRQRLNKDSREHIRQQLSPHAVKRRIRTRGFSRVISEFDLPIAELYKIKLSFMGVKLRRESRWLNAVSGYIDREDLSAIRGLSFVKSIRRVSKSKHQRNGFGDYQYGSSFAQNEIINIPRLHRELDLQGRGVRIAVFDTGFNSLSHRCFSGLNVVAAYDFVSNDGNVDDENEVENGSHGGQVLSCLAAFSEGELVGPAFGADYLLAKVSINNDEGPQDEDHWIAAMEWAEINGAHIVQSSISFNTGYSINDLDGETIPATIAADMAVDSFGIVVINSAGNEGQTTWQRINAPGRWEKGHRGWSRCFERRSRRLQLCRTYRRWPH